MKITSYGAAREVTGSRHLVEINGKKILFDCGMVQSRREESADRNSKLPFSVRDIDAVVLSHAHIDHSGTLPVLAKNGYDGIVYCTPATRDLCAIMLMDSSHIQQKDAEWLSKKNQSFVAPAYDDGDVHNIMKKFVGIPFDLPFQVLPGITLTFKEAGHVLGSAMCQVEFEENGRPRKYLFSGDIGRKNMAILRDPWEPTDADIVMMESTYGNREHDPIETLDDELAEIVNETHKKKGKLIVPSFALERAQEFVFALKRLEIKKRIPHLPVYVDSPLTVNITEVFRLHADSFDDEIRAVMEDSGDPFELNQISYIRSAWASKELNDKEDPCIIISAAGMCEHGRILHHLKNNIEDERNTVLIIGFQAKHTLGRKIVEREQEVKIFGVKHQLLAEVKVLNSLSAHAGRSDLLDFAGKLKDRAEKFILVHGEDESLNALKEEMEKMGCKEVIIQERGKPVEG
ncbi:MAG: MBL fold metallo-hydrolase [Candidatus Omnitrophica bacterium]|nr:MBL fold metallo-hydrolase [Candidatus Omnitrophota bacterium]